MTRRGLSLVLALALAVGALSGATISGGAVEVVNGDSDSNWVFFPWVPYGVMIEDQHGPFDDIGPIYGTVTIKNLENASVELYYGATSEIDLDDFTTWETMTLSAHQSTTLTVAELFEAPSDGGGVVAMAELSASHEPARIAGVQKQAASFSPTSQARTSNLHRTVGGYTGLDYGQISNSVILPIVQTNSNWNTLIRVTNFDANETENVSITLRPDGNSVWTATVVLEDVGPGETATFDLAKNGPPGEWVGSALIESDAPIAAVAERVKNETEMLIMNVSAPTADAGDEQYAPLVFQEWFSWNTGISVVNLTGQENTVDIYYYDRDGNLIDEDELVLPAHRMDFVYTPGTDGEEDGFVGSALLVAEGAIYGAVDEVKYTGPGEDVGHAMSYMIDSRTASLGESLAMPLVQKGQNGSGDNSGIQIFNPTEDFVVVGISYINQDGTEAHTYLQLIPAKNSHTSYTPDLPGVPSNFQGSAIIQVLAGDGAVVAASNIVNYDVIRDGSSSYNLIKTDAPGPEIPIEEIEEELNGE